MMIVIIITDDQENHRPCSCFTWIDHGTARGGLYVFFIIDIAMAEKCSAQKVDDASEFFERCLFSGQPRGLGYQYPICDRCDYFYVVINMDFYA